MLVWDKCKSNQLEKWKSYKLLSRPPFVKDKLLPFRKSQNRNRRKKLLRQRKRGDRRSRASTIKRHPPKSSQHPSRTIPILPIITARKEFLCRKSVIRKRNQKLRFPTLKLQEQISSRNKKFRLLTKLSKNS